jgi:hypothetical protein
MLTLLTCPDCANDDLLRQHLHEALCAIGRKPLYVILDAATLPPTDPRRAYPRPAVLLGRRDLFGIPEPPLPYPSPS